MTAFYFYFFLLLIGRFSKWNIVPSPCASSKSKNSETWNNSCFLRKLEIYIEKPERSTVQTTVQYTRTGKIILTEMMRIVAYNSTHYMLLFSKAKHRPRKDYLTSEIPYARELHVLDPRIKTNSTEKTQNPIILITEMRMREREREM